MSIGTGGLALAVTGIVLLVVFSSPVIVVAAVVLFAIGQKAFPPVIQAYLMDNFSDEEMGGNLGAVRTGYLAFGTRTNILRCRHHCVQLRGRFCRVNRLSGSSLGGSTEY